jgi:hypothetical protein
MPSARRLRALVRGLPLQLKQLLKIDKINPWAELRKDQPGPAERACFGECLQPFELGNLPPNFLKVGAKVTGALERAKDEGPSDHFAVLTCGAWDDRDNSSSASDAMRASASLAGSTESSVIWRAKVSI